MSNIAIPVLKFLFRDNLKAMEEALALSPKFTVEEFKEANELGTYLSTAPAGLVITSLKDKNDLIQIASFVKLQKKVAKDTAVKIVVVNFSGDRNFEKAIAKLGIQDLVEPGINTKALKFKLDFWMKSLNAQIKLNPNLTNQKTVKTSESNKSGPENKKATDPQAATWVDPLELEGDIWILRQDSDCKKILNRWLIRLMGPSPYIGQWIEVKNSLWKFDIKSSEKEMYTPNEGTWFYSGEQKPDYVWKENLWLMTGDSFELFFKDAEQSYSRFKCKDKSLTICKNSMYAKTKQELIIQSFDKELVFKKESENLEDLEGKNKTDQINNGNLQGKNKTPADKSGNLSGKTEGEEAINNDPLKGKTGKGADKSGHLTGKTNGEAPINHENLEQKTAGQEEKKHWKGHNEYEEDEINGNQEGAKQGSVKDGAQLELDQKHKEVQKYYKNHNEAEKYEASEKEKGSAQKNSSSDAGGEYGGKSDTDHLKSHYGQKEKAGKEAPSQENKDLSGQSSTDKLKNHYGSKGPGESEKPSKEKKQANGREAEDWYPSAEEKKELQFSDDDFSTLTEEAKKKKMGGEYEDSSADDFKGGASAADKIDSHYSSKKSAQKNSEESPEDELSSTKERKSSSEDKGYADILPIERGRTERSKAQLEEERELEELTAEARVICYLVQDSRKYLCNLDDFFDDQIIFLTDAKNLKASANVTLDMMFQFMKKDTKLKMEGNLVSIDSDGEGKNYITVNVSLENAQTFDAFMKLYQDKQRNVTEFLKRVKGL